jgi:hypothetical protein
MGTDFLVSEYSKFLRERRVKGVAKHIASRISDSFVPASEASCGSLYGGTDADLGMLFVQVWTDEINGRATA